MIVEYLEGVALVNEVLLPLGRVVHLRRVCADQRVEERVETTVDVRLHEYRYGGNDVKRATGPKKVTI